MARSAAQVLNGMNANTPADVTGLTLAYAYEDGTGNTVSDVSGNNNYGVLNPSASLPAWNPTGGVALAGTGTLVTLTVTDAAGNQATATARVRVQAPSVASVPTLTWTGTTSIDWSECSNWSYGLVPSASQSVSIPAGLSRYPVLNSGTFTINGLNVASGASFTLGTAATLQASGDVANNGPALQGTVRLAGSGTQAVAGSFGTLVVDKISGTATLSADALVNTVLTLTNGVLTTGSFALTLAPTATLTETATAYVTGTVQTTRPVSTAGTAQSFGGLGLSLTPSGTTLPGSTFVRRVTGTALTGVSNRQSVKRYFDIQPTVATGLNVALALTVRDDERNGIAPANLLLFKSENGGGAWLLQRATIAATAASGSQPATYTASLSGISNFSLWTLGNAAAPLPVELSSFTAQAEGRTAHLAWTTASEKNSARFDVERSLNGEDFAKIGEVAAGSSSTTRTYAYRDAAAPAGRLYYRLRQVDADGTFSYSPVRTVALAAVGALSLAPNPTRTSAQASGLAAGAAVEVFDALGRSVLRTQADAAGQATLTLPTGLATGLYVVRSGKQTSRLVVE